MKVYFLQRLIAYLIDFFIVFCIVTLFTFFVPTTNKYSDAVKENRNINKLYSNNEITKEEYIERYDESNYIIAKESYIVSFINLVVLTGYFGTYAYNCNGQTFGKKIMKFRLRGKGGEGLIHRNLIIRTIICHGVINSALSLMALPFVNANQYFQLTGIFNGLYTLFLIISVFMIIFRNDDKGIHDVLCNTEVIGVYK
jgi:uncharacterized RDD family membrane protein YckC